MVSSESQSRVCAPKTCKQLKEHALSILRVQRQRGHKVSGSNPKYYCKVMSIKNFLNKCLLLVTQLCPTLRPHGLQHARLPCQLLSLRVCSNSCPLSQWCYPNISISATPFSYCAQSLPALGSFPMNQLFAQLIFIEYIYVPEVVVSILHALSHLILAKMPDNSNYYYTPIPILKMRK